jgi:hypothetical protein
VSFGDLFKTLIEDWVRYRWRDTVALSMIVFGSWLLIHAVNAQTTQAGQTLLAAGMIMIDPKGMRPGTSGGGINGNGVPATSVPTSANPQAPATPPASPVVVEGWPVKK